MLAPLFNELTGLQAKHEERPSDSASEPGTSVPFWYAGNHKVNSMVSRNIMEEL